MSPTVTRFIRVYQGIIVSGVILLFCMIGFFVGAIPAAKQVLSQIDAMNTLTSDIALLRQKVNLLNGLDETILRNDLATSLSAVPSDKSLPSVFATIEALSSQTGASVLNMSVASGGTVATAAAAKATTATPQEKQVGAHIVPFTVTIEGGSPVLQQFISLAPAVRRLLRIRTFAITTPKSDRPLTVSIAMDAFYEPFPTTLGKAGVAATALTDAEEQTLRQLSGLPLLAGLQEAPTPLIGPAKTNPFSP